MTQTMQDQFEQAFSDDNGKLPVGFIKLQRLGDSYSCAARCPGLVLVQTLP